MNQPRPEHPNPQFVRKHWQNLNGEWEFEVDKSVVGFEAGYPARESFRQVITVPFCPESKLSGIGQTEFLNCVWYAKSFTVPKEHAQKRVLLTFGAVDYHAFLYINGEFAGEHRGGYTPFRTDITDLLKPGENRIVLAAKDDCRLGTQPAGKQSAKLHSHGCFYTRTTGIWQTVWLEFIDPAHIVKFRTQTDAVTGDVSITVHASPEALGRTLDVAAYWDGKEVGRAQTTIQSLSHPISFRVSELHLWDIGAGNLYDVTLTISNNGVVSDQVESYFGIRSVCLSKKSQMLNGRAFFGRYVLDQGFYPDGIYTAPTDEALKQDILLSQALGFNGARLHEKIFEPRFLYWADKLGYLVWGEHANWGLKISDFSNLANFLPEWIEGVERDYNHPSIIGWCPFNETWDDNPGKKRQDDRVLQIVYQATKAVDPSRPVIDTSGNYHVVTDIYDVHDYTQDGAKFAGHYTGEVFYEHLADRQQWRGEPYFVSEYGGIRWAADSQEGWGYGDAPKTEEEFIERFRSLTLTLLQNPNICALCYTQLYDVEQEVNGLYTYARKPKFDPGVIRKILTTPAAIEQ